MTVPPDSVVKYVVNYMIFVLISALCSANRFNMEFEKIEENCFDCSCDRVDVYSGPTPDEDQRIDYAACGAYKKFTSQKSKSSQLLIVFQSDSSIVLKSGNFVFKADIETGILVAQNLNSI